MNLGSHESESARTPDCACGRALARNGKPPRCRCVTGYRTRTRHTNIRTRCVPGAAVNRRARCAGPPAHEVNL
eukprot:6691231-Prymnesium_polylepis.1